MSNVDKTLKDAIIRNASVSGNGTGTYKQEGNSDPKLYKRQAIAKLKCLNYLTPPSEIESYLNIIFDRWEENPDYWLHIAQHYTPKTINSVINQMIKQHKRKDVTIKNMGAYFSHIIKYRHKRKIFRRHGKTP